MVKVILWIGAIVLGFMAWQSGLLHEQTGDMAYLKQAIGWGIGTLACVTVALNISGSSKSGKKRATARSSAGS